MKKIITIAVTLMISIVATAQIPYFAGTIPDKEIYTYTSVKFRPGINMQETYTTIQYGIGNWFNTGVDLYTSPGYEALGYTLRFNAVRSNYFNLGFQVTPSFALHDSHKFAYNTTAMYINGSIIPDGRLFYVSNTWWGWNRGNTHTINQWWYLGWYQEITQKVSITPMVGCIHTWKFDSDPTLAVGAYVTYKYFNFYLWTDKWFDKNPRIVIGVDFKFPAIEYD